MVDNDDVGPGPLQKAAALLAVGALVMLGAAPAAFAAPTETCTVLDFAGLPHGTVLGEQLAGQGIHLSAAANEGRPNTLIVFDSGRTGTPDPDLQAGIGNLAIIPENVDDADGDGLVDRPSDSIRGGRQIYTFDSPRTVKSLVVVDIDHGVPTSHAATAFDEANNVIATAPLVIGSDGNVQTVQLNATGVRRLEVRYRDSAGVTRIDLGCVTSGGGTVPITATVDKTNDANGDAAFTDDETATSEGAPVAFRVVVTNTSTVPAVITGVTDAVGAQQLTFSATPDPVGKTLAPGESLTFHFTLPGYSPASGTSVVDTVTVQLAQDTDASNTTSASDTSTVRTVVPPSGGGGGGGVVTPPGGGVVTPPHPVTGGGGVAPTLPTTGDHTGLLLLVGIGLVASGTLMTAGASRRA